MSKIIYVDRRSLIKIICQRPWMIAWWSWTNTVPQLLAILASSKLGYNLFVVIIRLSEFKVPWFASIQCALHVKHAIPLPRIVIKMVRATLYSLLSVPWSLGTIYLCHRFEEIIQPSKAFTEIIFTYNTNTSSLKVHLVKQNSRTPVWWCWNTRERWRLIRASIPWYVIITANKH